MNNFDFLKEPFFNWLDEKIKEVKDFQNFSLAKNANEISIYDSGVDFSELDENLQNLGCLPPSAMNLLLQRFIHYYKDFVPKDAPVLFKIDFEINNLPNALDWLLVNIADLNFFDMSGIEYKQVFNQCHYCGEPNEFKHFSGSKKFNKKIRFCHSFDCQNLNKTDGSNPLEHESCCFGKYAQSKKKLYQQMKAKKVSKEDKIKKFIAYCENKLEECKDIKWTVQTISTPAKHESVWFEE